ncbi:hypothetical protein DFH11DRAFT_1704045 [Phellopilus nigrolimitatus]|nr:hypothetical protein DFH11DRAFT_1704045 [Phellopilus nigrolimitatus]
MPVYLPLETVDKCSRCQAVNNLSLCSSCGERLYCSSACQKADWPTHKPLCGKTDRIDLSTFYPLLAALAELARSSPDVPLHPACVHQITNDVNPGAPPTRLPDGSAAKLLLLGRRLRPAEFQGARSGWWPAARTPAVEAKLMRRIFREGYLFPLVAALCAALVAEIYTTTSTASSAGPASVPSEPTRRARLRYRTSPIADLGICFGAAHVAPQDRLAYALPNGDLLLGQDPAAHCWLYFTTARGEEVTLDVGMFALNMCLAVLVAPHLPAHAPHMNQLAPAFFCDRLHHKNASGPRLYSEHRRVSVLRDAAAQEILGERDFFEKPESMDKLTGLMESFSGEPFTGAEKTLFKNSTARNCRELHAVLADKRWKQFPSPVQECVEHDPGELDDLDDPNTDWAKKARKWKREHKRIRKNNDRSL